MQCSWVQERLVALHDAELSPGELTFVTEHLVHCEECSIMEQALIDVTPAPFLEIPLDVQLALERSVDTAIDEALAQPKVPKPLRSPWMRWLRRERDLSNGAMLTYGFVLAACLGWGLSNWLAVHNLQTTVVPSHQLAQDSMAAPQEGSPLAPDQYRPASWTAEEGPEPWR